MGKGITGRENSISRDSETGESLLHVEKQKEFSTRWGITVDEDEEGG